MPNDRISDIARVLVKMPEDRLAVVQRVVNSLQQNAQYGVRFQDDLSVFVLKWMPPTAMAGKSSAP